MAIHLGLHREMARRRRQPAFGVASRALAAALAEGSTAPLARAVEEVPLAPDDVLFAAFFHGVSGLVHALPGALPAPLAEGLAAERERIRRRGERLAEDARRLGRLAAARGLPFVPLKGAYLSTERYRDVSLRPAADIDLLAPPGTWKAWCELLSGEGYEVETESFKNRVYARPGARASGAPGEHEDNPRPVELHDGLRERLLGRRVEITDAYLADLRDGTVQGVPARVPGEAGLLLHLLAHAAPAAVMRGLRLVQIADFRLLHVAVASAGALASHLGEAAWGVCRLLARELPGCLPDALLAALEPLAPPEHRRRLWLSRPGLATGGPLEDEVLLGVQLSLALSARDRAAVLLDVVPDRSIIANLYGVRTPYLLGLARYVRDRSSS